MFTGLDIGAVLLLGVPLLATLLVTVVSCHYRSARNKRVSLAPSFLGAVAAPSCTLLVVNLFQDGLKVFSLAYWTADAGLAELPVLWAFAAGVCFLPALGIYGYYRTKQRS
jgi:hypothetical protein